MNHWTISLVAVTLGGLVVAANTGGSPSDEAIALVLAADSPRALARAYVRLLRDAPEERLRQLIADPACGPALAAAWERVRRTVPKELTKEKVTPASVALSRFLGVVEGRLQVPVPDRWTAAVEAAGSYGRADFFFPIDRQRVWADASKEGQPVVRQKGNHWLVTAEGKTWSIPSGRREMVDRASVVAAGDRIYIALYSWPPLPYSLYAIDAPSGKVAWSARVWAAGGLTGYEGPGWHGVAMQVDEGRVLVFGESSDAVYIEAFDARHGKNLWRFATKYPEMEEE